MVSIQFLEQVATAIEARGVTSGEHDVAVVVDAARVSGARPVLADVLADRTQPPVARERAFGLLALALSHLPVASAVERNVAPRLEARRPSSLATV